MRTKIKIAIFLLIPFMTAVAFGAPSKPTPGGSSPSLGNFGSQMPNLSAVRMSTQPYAYPTNRWWGSVYIANQYHNYSLQMSLGATLLSFHNGVPGGWSGANGAGYIIGAQQLTTATVNGIDSFGVNLHSSNAMHVLATKGGENYIRMASPKVTSFSDWAVTTVVQDQTNSADKMNVTFAKGSPFTYNTFSSTNISPQLRFANNYTSMTYVASDRAMIRVSMNNAKYVWYGLYAPPGTTFSNTGWWIDINFSSMAVNEADRYLSIAYLGVDISSVSARALYDEYYNYAYNFITDTKVDWEYNTDSSITTTFNYEFDVKRSGGNFLSDETVFLLFPHQWRNLEAGSYSQVTGSPEYVSLRGKMKAYKGESFKTKYQFHGMLPALTFEVPQENISNLEDYISKDQSFAVASFADNMYRRGKAMAKVANMIPVFHQAGKITERDKMKDELKAELVSWYKHTFGHSFAYDGVWGGIMGIPYRNGVGNDDFGAELFNDHHFHNGYFIYASAILAMYDPDFALSSQYKDIVDLLIRDFASKDRNDTSFPFLRNFDVYEGHSWSNGKGFGHTGDDGIDQESISEAINAWTGVYLWGIVTNNTDLIKLGIYGYTTEASASDEYYFDNYATTYPAEYNHRGGILYDSIVKYVTHWDTTYYTTKPQERYGILILPMTPSMLYLGHDTSAARVYHEKMKGESNQDVTMWRDVWLRYQSLYDASGALSEWNNVWRPTLASQAEQGSSLSFSYHFINFFNALGTVSKDYYATDNWGNSVPFTVMKSSNNAYTYIAYNSGVTEKDINFMPRLGSGSAPNGGIMKVPPKVMVKTSDFRSFGYDLTEVSLHRSSNTARNIYSIYSDNFLGAVVNGNEYQDNLALNSWEQTISFSSHSSFAGAYEGEGYLSATRTDPLWGGWGFRFAESSIDMSAYYGGKIEFSIRIPSVSTAAANFEVGFETGYAKVFFTLASLGFDYMSTDWQTLTIDLTDGFHQYITEKSLTYTVNPFMMLHNAGNLQSEWGIPVYIDSILWKKDAISPNIYPELKNCSNDQPALSINWLYADFMNQDAVAQQYLEIALTNVEGNSWGVQIYTDNKSSKTVADAEFAGVVSSVTASGLVNSKYADVDMLPMRWRVASSSIPVSSVFVPQEASFWSFFRDVCAFDDNTGLNSRCEEIKFMDRRGYKYNALDYIPLPLDKIVRVYFIADFRNARHNITYMANIILEYFNE